MILNSSNNKYIGEELYDPMHYEHVCERGGSVLLPLYCNTPFRSCFTKNSSYCITILSGPYQLIIQISHLVTSHAIYFSFDTMSVTVSDSPFVISVTYVTSRC